MRQTKRKGTMNEALSNIAASGVLGSIVVVLFVAYYLKDKKLSEETARFQQRLSEEYEKRLADRREFQKLLSDEAANRIKDGVEERKLVMEVQAQAIEAVHKITDALEYVEKRDEDSRRRT
jgi:hypothetical protein